MEQIEISKKDIIEWNELKNRFQAVNKVKKKLEVQGALATAMMLPAWFGTIFGLFVGFAALSAGDMKVGGIATMGGVLSFLILTGSITLGGRDWPMERLAKIEKAQWVEAARYCLKEWTLDECLGFMQQNGFSSRELASIPDKKKCLKKITQEVAQELVYTHLKERYDRLATVKKVEEIDELERDIYEAYWDVIKYLKNRKSSKRKKKIGEVPQERKHETQAESKHPSKSRAKTRKQFVKEVMDWLAQNPIITLNELAARFSDLSRTQLVNYLTSLGAEKKIYLIENTVISPGVLSEIGVIFTSLSEDMRRAREQKEKGKEYITLLLEIKEKLIALRLLSDQLKNPYLESAVERAEKELTTLL